MGLQPDDAWDAALDAPPGDDGPWRVLADMLVAEGNPQGELIQLELDSERGPLRGLARLRAQQLREAPDFLLPAGVRRGDVVLERGALVSVSCLADQLTGAEDDARWRTVRALQLRFVDAERPVPRVPLAGGQLRRVESLAWLTPEAVELLARSPPAPRLARLTVSSTRSVPPSRWAALWNQLLPNHPKLRELRFSSPRAPGVDLVQEWLTPLLGLPLERVVVSASLEQVRDLFEWRCRVSPAFAVLLRVGPEQLHIELTPQELVLHAPHEKLLADDRLRRARRLVGDVSSPADTETLIRLSWGAPSGPPPIRWPRAKGGGMTAGRAAE